MDSHSNTVYIPGEEKEAGKLTVQRYNQMRYPSYHPVACPLAVSANHFLKDLCALSQEFCLYVSVYHRSAW